MSLPPPQTPPKALPGAYLQTPAFTRFSAGAVSQQSSYPASTSLQKQHGAQNTGGQALSRQPQTLQATDRPAVESLRPIERAARGINDTLNQDSRYPEIDSYIGREFSVCDQSFTIPRLTVRQRAFHRITMYRRCRHGLLSRKRKCTRFQTRYSSNTTVPKYRL